MVTWHQVRDCLCSFILSHHVRVLHAYAVTNDVSVCLLRRELTLITTEYASTGKASRKSDVFSYGVMLLEVVTGKKPTDAMFSEELSLREWVRQAIPSGLAHVVDHSILLVDEEATSSGDVLRADWSCLAQMLNLGLQCSCDLPENRVSMKDVADELARIKKSLLCSR